MAGTVAKARRAPGRALSVPERVLLGAVALFLVASYLVPLLGESAVDTLIEEDGPIEMLGAAGLFAAAVFFFISFRRLRAAEGGSHSKLKPLACLLLALLFLFGAGEEVSWGQRLFGFGTPEELEEVNKQDETNVHNVLTGSALSMDRLFSLFWLAFAVALPVLVALSERARRLFEPHLPIVPLVIAALFVSNQALAMIAELVIPEDAYDSKYPFVHTLTEIKETNFGVLFGVAAAMVAASLARRSAAAARDDDARTT